MKTVKYFKLYYYFCKIINKKLPMVKDNKM